MKKLLPLLFFLFPILITQAQTGLHVGANLGFNSVWILNQNNYGFQELDYERKFGISGGIAVGYKWAETYGMQAELNFVKLGQNYSALAKDFGPHDNKLVKVETWRYVDLSYIQLPIMFQYQTERKKKDKNRLSYHAMAGPCLGFLISADQYYKADVLDDGNLVVLDNGVILDPRIEKFALTPAEEDPKEYFSGVDFGGQLDIGVDIYIKDFIYITPALRGFYGLTDINSPPARELIGSQYKGASHNAYGGFNLSIHVNLGEK